MAFSYVTQKSFDEFKEKLDYLMKVKRREIAKQMEHARGFGDLSENAEYDAAREALNQNEAKIQEMSEKLASMRILDDSKIAKDKVFLGATIKLFDEGENEEIEYTMVSEAEADILAGKLSVVSPLGKALLGHKVNDKIKVKAPGGETLRFKVLDISR
jgi:transcription elongation factor GreA